MGVCREEPLPLEEKNNLVLIGFMGTGKTSIGRALAQKLGMEFVDTDKEIEQATGMTVNRIFKRYGEVRFRSEETLAIKKAVERDNCVISTGGGAMLREENRQLLRRSGYLVCLESRPEVICRRVGKNTRPLLARGHLEQRVMELLRERQPYYQGADLVVDTSDADQQAVVERIATWLVKKRSCTVKVKNDAFAYDILIGVNILPAVGGLVGELLTGKSCLLVTNPTVAAHYQQVVGRSLAEAGIETAVHVVPDGEEYKSLEIVQGLYGAAIEAGIGRDGCIVALGGGVIGDLAGFAASTYLRGISLIQVPTTLLAQVDSSVGGKVAVNHPLGKNLIGAFHQPKLVVCDLSTLRTLPLRELQAGMAEIIKYGVIWDGELFGCLEEHLEAALKLDTAALRRIVARCCQIKGEIVAQDEREQGLRALLNFGHTVGHALEGATGYTVYRHGEAVAVGMLAAGRLAELLGKWSSAEQRRLMALLRRAGLPDSAAGVDIRSLNLWLRQDKKKRGDKLRWVLPAGIGRAEVGVEVPPDLVEAVLGEFFKAGRPPDKNLKRQKTSSEG